MKDHYPAVIVVHTLAGYRDANEGYFDLPPLRAVA
jgi:hypothetical protein